MTGVRVDFYQLRTRPLEAVLPAICERVVAQGGRLLVVAGEEQLRALDRQLWSYERASFLPHGQANQPRATDQPVLLSPEARADNNARNLAIVDGVWRDEALGFDRTFYFFDGAGVDAARTAWRRLRGAEGAELHFWKQNEAGRWEEGP